MSKLKYIVCHKKFLIMLITTAILVVLVLATNSTALAFIDGKTNVNEPSKTDVNYQFGYGGGGDGGTTLPPGTTDIHGAATTAGRFIIDVNASSEDHQCSMYIPTGTTGLTKDLQPLTQLSIVPMTTQIEPPEDTNIIGIPYNFGPTGATFDPPITITFTIPPGVDVSNLKIAIYALNPISGKMEWKVLTNIHISADGKTISGDTDHFTTFAVIVPSRPAAFTFSALNISPTELEIGESVSISLDIANTGDLAGTYDVTLKINNTTVETKQIRLTGHTSQKVTFSTSRDTAGSYTVNIGTQTGTFTVKAAPAPTTTTPAPTTTTPAPTTTTPAPTTTTPALTTTTPAQTITPTPAPINWSVFGSLIAGAIVIAGLLVYFLWWRRRSA